MAGKALAFERANPATGASHLKVVTDLEALVARVDTVFAQERLGTIAERAATARRKVVRNELALNLRHLVHVAERAAKRDPALAGKFVAPDYQGPNRAIVAHAKAMLGEARVHEALLTASGLGATFLADFGVAITSFESASLDLDAGRRDHIAARADFTALAGECSELVGILDGLNRKRFAKEPDLLATWKSVRNVFGPFTRQGGAPETPMGLLPPGV
jgi:hypothetical protein